jgi:hypothetical protein
MSKKDYWMNPSSCEAFNEDPGLALRTLIPCINFIKAVETARKELDNELQKLGFPKLDEIYGRLT